MEALRIRCGIHRHRPDAHLAATTDYTDGYLAAVRYQYAFYRHNGIFRFNGLFVKAATGRMSSEQCIDTELAHINYPEPEARGD
jgi:hypothetical protein